MAAGDALPSPSPDESQNDKNNSITAVNISGTTSQMNASDQSISDKITYIKTESTGAAT